MRFREFHFFAIGFLIGSSVILVPFFFYKNNRKLAKEKFDRRLNFHRETEHKYENLYSETLSKMLYDKVRVLCMVMTHPANHRTKAIHIQNTWGKRCNKLVFISSEMDLVLDTVVLPIEESRAALWNKTRASFQYLYDHFRHDYDFFMKADDDNYIVVENLRFMLAHYDPKTALYFGHRYAVQGLDSGYMAGGGYILSQKALEKFAEVLIHNSTVCHPNGGAEDLEMGRCLEKSALFVDCRDDHQQKRFFPIGVKEHMKHGTPDPKFWYTKNQYYHVAQGGPECCSDTSVGFHYIGPHELYALEYFIYNVHPFGVNHNFSETLPRKFSIKEIIDASDHPSSSPNFRLHPKVHFMDPSEIY